MIAEPIAVQMAAQSTHRHIHDAKRERAARRVWRRPLAPRERRRYA